MAVLIVATGNPGKVKEMAAYLASLGWELRLKPPNLEIEETGHTFLENACLKASQVAKATGEWAIADDSGLEVEALNGEPGIYSARYGNCRSDVERTQHLLTKLADHPNRKAQFVCAIAIAQPDGTIALQSEGICLGEILPAPRGNGGFGYDPVFYLPEHQMTFAEMPAELKNAVSHRGKAFTSLIPQLASAN
ncbi:MAG: RdgB/HAM1 family non-canonical purine NTP pyrophosphatase [Oscillatoriales cyanobacterium C42_A2020_001]|nr:RdgB/HAM1 family non-canonical purine NTP pyrophosphatase [Leptolyngbyaceae cyanobacterium C42_A2020_001]